MFNKHPKAMIIQDLSPGQIAIPKSLLVPFVNGNETVFSIAAERTTGPFNHLGQMYLSDSYEWAIIEDSNDYLVLICMKKEI